MELNSNLNTLAQVMPVTATLFNEVDFAVFGQISQHPCLIKILTPLWEILTMNTEDAFNYHNFNAFKNWVKVFITCEHTQFFINIVNNNLIQHNMAPISENCIPKEMLTSIYTLFLNCLSVLNTQSKETFAFVYDVTRSLGALSDPVGSVVLSSTELLQGAYSGRFWFGGEETKAAIQATVPMVTLEFVNQTPNSIESLISSMPNGGLINMLDPIRVTNIYTDFLQPTPSLSDFSDKQKVFNLFGKSCDLLFYKPLETDGGNDGTSPKRVFAFMYNKYAAN